MQKAVSSTFGSADLDPLAEADDLDALGVFLKSSEVSEDEILRTKTLLVSRTFTDVHRDVVADVSVDATEQEPVELVQDASLDESLAMKKKTAKEKQQVWNRSRSELLGSDHKTSFLFQELLFVISWMPGITYRIPARRPSRSCIVLVIASCFRELIICLMIIWAQLFPISHPSIRFANGARRKLTSQAT